MQQSDDIRIHCLETMCVLTKLYANQSGRYQYFSDWTKVAETSYWSTWLSIEPPKHFFQTVGRTTVAQMDLLYLADGSDKHNHDNMWMKEPYITVHYDQMYQHSQTLEHSKLLNII